MSGVVYLIGAGPGSPDLISLRALRLLQRADMIVMDTLLPESFLDDLGITGKQVIRVQDDNTKKSKRQDEINRLMLDGAKRGLKVARLKGGDPFLFGRGWEEIILLDENDVAWEVVPGISSAMAVPASASVPLTIRHTGRSVAFFTARLAGGDANRKMPKADTIVVMMGVKVLHSVVEHFVSEGWSPDTPVCVIERGCQPGERQVMAPLSEIASAVEKARIKPPAITIIGAGAGRPELINRHPRILFTGYDPAPFRYLGNILHWPVQAVTPRNIGKEEIAAALDNLAEGDASAILFEDEYAVRRFFETLSRADKDARALGRISFVAASRFAEWELNFLQLQADLVVDSSRSEDVIPALRRFERILLVEGISESAGFAGMLSEMSDIYFLKLFSVQPGQQLGEPLPEHEVIFIASSEDTRLLLDTYGKRAFQGEIWCLTHEIAANLEKMAPKDKIVLVSAG
ncbi:MAG: uroporphyrinogen-III C-methyltransferase [Planctomycetota bacterium]|jgi:uroporphyrinogen III methyltransferase/synthase